MITRKSGLKSPYTTTWFKWNGEKRPPKKGEFFISGAIPEVYQAPNDLSYEYHIAVPVATPQKKIVVDGFTYQLVE